MTVTLTFRGLRDVIGPVTVRSVISYLLFCFFGQFSGKTHRLATIHLGESVLDSTTGSASDQQSTNDRKVAGSRPTKVVCITVLTGNRMGRTARCGRSPLLPSCRKLEFRLSALMDSDLAWVNSKSGIDKVDATMLTLSSAL